MDTAQLQAFVSTIESGSVSAAAARLHLTQSAVTKRLQALESQLGETLLDRIGRGVQLTDAGQRLVPIARRILADMTLAQQAVRSAPGTVTGELNLATSHHLGLHRLPSVLSRFSRAYPAVDLNLEFLDSEEGCDAVESGRLELAVVTLPRRPSTRLLTRVIWEDPLTLCAAPDHPLTTQADLTIEHLGRHAAILPDRRTFTHRLIADALAQVDMAPKVRMSTNYLETIKMLVSIGLGWSALPRTMLDDSIVALPLDLNIHRSLGTAVHRGRTLSGPARAFLSVLEPATG
ncbi:LysR family transcriptional regulator [Abyssibacter sp.]|uniref:LysR family transcriptional regulator n=1 Tax=Abyssibacter sp. TaxID=2320200 RepID=UPI000C67BCF1|nr:LysR family transcriptional regulator [Abyssibacter sp.]MBB86674.1 LysR family transcriptional regulator [Xanthomonadales bacterium]MCK5858391.1 LysR family transcriptional regulator [Abyssibacter sp.]